MNPVQLRYLARTIRQTLAASPVDLRGGFGRHHAEALIFDALTAMNDLARAGISPKDTTGRVLHFHSFRKTFQTLGARHGIGQRSAQELLGHSDPRLTADVYTDIAGLELHAEIQKLPWLGEGLPPTEDATAIHSLSTGLPRAKQRFESLCRELLDFAKTIDSEQLTALENGGRHRTRRSGGVTGNYLGGGQFAAAASAVGQAIRSLREHGKALK